MKRDSITTSTLNEEIRQLERELMPLREQEGSLQQEISATKRELRNAEQSTPVILMNGDLGLNPKRRAAAAEHESRLSRLRSRLSRAEEKCRELLPGLSAKVSRLQTLRARREQEQTNSAYGVVADAVEKARAAKQEFEAHQTKLCELRSQLTAVEEELHALQTQSVPTAETDENRAKILLETGSFELTAVPQLASKIAEVQNKHRTVAAAIRIQERSVETSRRMFAHQVAGHLRPAMEAVVKNIAQGVRTAMTATANAERIRDAFSRSTGAETVLPCFVFHQIPAPSIDVKDAFGFWLDDMREQGYDV